MNEIMQFLIIVFLVIFADTKSTLQGIYSRKYINNTQDSLLFNGLIFTIISVLFIMLFQKAPLCIEIVKFAVLCAFGTVVYQVCFAISMSTGPVSLSCLIINLNVLITTAFSAICFREKIYITQALGLFFLTISLVFNTKSSDKEDKISKKWFVITFLGMLGVGFSSSMLKLFAKTEFASAKNSDITLMIIMYIISAIASFIIYFINSFFGKHKNATIKHSKELFLFAFLVSIFLGIYQKVNMVGMKNIDGSFMFPVYYGLCSITMTILGLVLFKDKLLNRQKIGILFGIASIVLFNVRTGFWFYIQ